MTGAGAFALLWAASLLISRGSGCLGTWILRGFKASRAVLSVSRVREEYVFMSVFQESVSACFVVSDCDMCPAVKKDVNLFLTGSPDEYVAQVKKYQNNSLILANARKLKDCIDQKLTEEDKEHAITVLLTSLDLQTVGIESLTPQVPCSIPTKTLICLVLWIPVGHAVPQMPGEEAPSKSPLPTSNFKLPQGMMETRHLLQLHVSTGQEDTVDWGPLLETPRCTGTHQVLLSSLFLLYPTLPSTSPR
ncbi:hypothetical protein QTO34_010505 [Cnephaeus nilssonii]|uniref:Uncharacterized protein n=1 Tax=Cnephaeus nilssonii TaxID=3371016 RepID=A0AA40LFJ1_CNENI|nr:hypothetical protein QTO34_010505 [Eptesicus nilssonii]